MAGLQRKQAAPKSLLTMVVPNQNVTYWARWTAQAVQRELWLAISLNYVDSPAVSRMSVVESRTSRDGVTTWHSFQIAHQSPILIQTGEIINLRAIAHTGYEFVRWHASCWSHRDLTRLFSDPFSSSTTFEVPTDDVSGGSVVINATFRRTR